MWGWRHPRAASCQGRIHGNNFFELLCDWKVLFLCWCAQLYNFNSAVLTLWTLNYYFVDTPMCILHYKVSFCIRVHGKSWSNNIKTGFSPQHSHTRCSFLCGRNWKLTCHSANDFHVFICSKNSMWNKSCVESQEAYWSQLVRLFRALDRANPWNQEPWHGFSSTTCSPRE